MKSDEPRTRTSKRSQGKASTIATVSDVMPAVEEAFVDPTTVVSSGVDDVDSTVSLPLSLFAMMLSFMTIQATHGQLLDEFLTEVATLRADFVEYRSAFPPPPPSDD